MLSQSRVESILKEFTDFVLVDKDRDSIVVNVRSEYYGIISYELRKYGYRLIHKSSVDNKLKSLTLVFMIQD